MTERAVRDFYVATLDGQVFGNHPPAKAWAEVPHYTNSAGGPQLFVWMDEGEEHREAASRFSGLRRVEHHVHIAVAASFEATDTLSLLDITAGVKAALRGVTLPQPITDVVTTQQSNIQLIGERLRYRHELPRALRRQRMMGYTAVLEDFCLEVAIG